MPGRSRPEQRNTTHFIPNGHTKANMLRTARMERTMTKGTGGILAEQPDPTVFQRMLDIGCGTGSWVIDAARTYPSMFVAGIDIDGYTIQFARTEAEAAQVDDRVEFHLMDALKPLAFAEASFDLVNLRMGGGFLRTWDWPKVLREMERVTRPGGIIRLVELETLNQSNSKALDEMGKLISSAFFHAGRFFEPEPTGLIAHLEGQLRLLGCQNIQTKSVTAVMWSGTRSRQILYEIMVHNLLAMRFFVKKWSGCDLATYDELYQQALFEIQQDDFQMQWYLQTVWGVRSETL